MMKGAELRRATTVLLGAIAALLLLPGCEADHSDVPDSAVAAGGTPSPPAPTAEKPTTEDKTTVTPAFAQSIERQSAPASGGANLVLVDVRVAEVDGFDRIVLKLRGTGTPGWVVDYVDEAVLDGIGERVALGGEAVLDIYAAGTTWPAPDYYRGPIQLTPENAGAVEDVYVGSTFEGYTQVLAGIDGEAAPFRVYALTAPSRLVVDVVHNDAD